jgi:hypothetical protein
VVTRREFLVMSAGAVAHAAFSRREAAGVLRVGTATDPARVELERGLAFGAAEAQRSASLFKWTVERVELPAGSTTGLPPVDAVILGVPGPVPNDNLPTLRLVCDTSQSADGSFMLAPCGAAESDEVWQPTLERYGAAQLNDRYRSATGTPMTGEAWLGWFAFKALTDSALKLGTPDPARLRAHLGLPTTHFDGHKGVTLRFDGARRLAQPLYAKDRAPSGA